MSDKAAAVPTPEALPEKKGTRSRPAKVRSHRSDTVYKQDMPKYLDKIHVEGFIVLAVCQAIDIRGFEVVSYKEQ